MKKLVVLAAAMVAYGSVFNVNAQAVPRVFNYKSTVTTTGAKVATNVKWTDQNGDEFVEDYIVYRVATKATVRGVLWTDCVCPDFANTSLPTWAESMFLLESTDNKGVVYYNNVVETLLITNAVPVSPRLAYFGTWDSERFGAALPNKALKAGMAIWVELDWNNACPWRGFWLDNAGHGTASIVETSGNHEITSISGNTIGGFETPWATEATGCAACNFALNCEEAVGYIECTDDNGNDPFDPNQGQYTGDTVAFGTFTFKFNKTLSTALKPYPGTTPAERLAQVTLLKDKGIATGARFAGIAD